MLLPQKNECKSFLLFILKIFGAYGSGTPFSALRNAFLELFRSLGDCRSEFAFHELPFSLGSES
jgi:hypothetical protein